MGSEINSIGLIELSSVAAGYMVEDCMLKAGAVRLLLARTICSGKFLIAITGDVTSVEAALHAGAATAGEPSRVPASDGLCASPAARSRSHRRCWRAWRR